MNESKILTLLAIGIIVIGGGYLFKRLNILGKQNINFDSKINLKNIDNDLKDKVLTYLNKIKEEEKEYFKSSYLSLYFDISQLSQKVNFKSTKRISGPYELGASFEESELIYLFLRDELDKLLGLKNDLSNSRIFMITLDYYNYLGKKEALHEVKAKYEIDKNTSEKYLEVLKQLENELKILKS